MKAVRYTQANGFTDVESMEDALGLPQPAADKVWDCAALEAAGWHLIEEYGGEGVPYTNGCVYTRGDADFIVELDLGAESWEFVIVSGRADLMALRLALMPLFQLGVLEEVRTLGTTPERLAFRHEHGHDALSTCPKCRE